jgi:hypothetical protein
MSGGESMKSNCLFEALKAKLRNPKGVKMFKVPKELNDHTHFMWREGDFYYHAYIKNYDRFHFLFDFKIKKIPAYVFESYAICYIKLKDEKTKRKLAKKMALKFTEMGNEWDWCIVKYRNKCLPKQSDLTYYEKVLRRPLKFKVCQNGEMKTMTLKEMKKIKGNFEWKFIGLFDQDFSRVYRDLKYSDLSDLQN